MDEPRRSYTNRERVFMCSRCGGEEVQRHGYVGAALHVTLDGAALQELEGASALESRPFGTIQLSLCAGCARGVLEAARARG